MLAFVVIGVVMVVSGVACLRYLRYEERLPLPLRLVALLGGMLWTVVGVLSLYLSYLTTTDDFGR